MVRMGELVTSDSAGDVLVSLGLGSCIGLALLDRRRGLAGLAHVVLPASGRRERDAPGKFADLAVPALVDELAARGGVHACMEAVLVGGAQMFSFGSRDSLDVGSRNEAAVRTALAAARIPVRAAATAGAKGRTVRVHVAEGVVTVKEAGGSEGVLYGSEVMA